mgnify:CR=1 FL=1
MSLLRFDPKIENLEQAHELYYKYLRDGNDIKRIVVLEKWNEMFLPKIQEFSQKKDADLLFEKDIENFFYFACSRYLPPEGKARDLAVEFGNKIYGSITLSQAVKINNSFSGYQKTHGNNFVSAMKNKWQALAISEIEERNDFDSLKLLISRIPSTTYELFFKKLCGYASSINHIKEISRINAEVGSYSAVNKMIEKKTDKILFIQIPKIEDINLIKECYRIAPAKSVTTIMAFEKWLELCKTPEEANEAFKSAPENKIMCSLSAYKRAKELAYSPPK